MILKRILPIIPLLLLSLAVISQNNDDKLPEEKPGGKSEPTVTESEKPIHQPEEDFKKFDWSKIHVGGNIGLSFGSTILAGAEPKVGYMITPWLEPGIGGIYYYEHINQQSYMVKAHNYGGLAFLKVYPFDKFFVIGQAETQTIRYKEKYTTWSPQWQNITYGNVFAGGGYDVEMGDNAWFTLSLTTNLITNQFYDKHRLYFNTGFEFAL